MSFIEEQRESALEENSAQGDLLDYLENLLPTISEIDIRIPLVGDLDFNILKECNFNNITSIRFIPGKVTSINNIPEGITFLHCSKNLLTNIQGLPSSITDLTVSYNGIKQLEFESLPNLKNLDIDHNQFTQLENISPSLETLSCNNNTLKRIDLEGIVGLKVLHCSNNNPSLIIEKVPDTITDLKSDHSPLIDMQRESDVGESVDESGNSAGPEFTESLERYFELKTDYERKLRTIQKNVYKKALSKKAAKASLKMIRPPCIQCSRPVGSIFSNENRSLTALCGDRVKPCTLNIKIYAGQFESIDKELLLLQEIVESAKESIIRLKMDALFNYTDEKKAAGKFKEEFENYNASNVMLNELQRKYEELHFSDEKHDKIKAKQMDIDKTKEDIARFLQEYKTTGNKIVLEQALTKHIKELIPETQNQRYNKYETMEVNETEPAKFRRLFTLFQKDISLKKLDFTFGEPPRVVKFSAK